VTKLNEVDRKIIRELLRGEPTQADLATAIGATPSATTASLLRLRRLGIITLHRRGQHQVPRLAVLGDVVNSLNRLESAVLSLVEATAA
jgi:DNA-binding transcriptional ArsR family regulator